ncbi:hypothetical protein CsatB_027444 [Cannabis sativa]
MVVVASSSASTVRQVKLDRESELQIEVGYDSSLRRSNSPEISKRLQWDARSWQRSGQRSQPIEAQASGSQAIGILLMWRRYHLGRPLVRRPQFGSEYNLEPELVQEG